MIRKMSLVLAVVMLAALFLVACQPAAPAATGKKVCLVTDAAGLGDKSFNDLAWSGVEKAQKDLGVVGKAIESKNENDYEPNLNACVAEKSDLIICVGGMMTTACEKSVKANPKIMYAGVDIYLFGLPNFRGVDAYAEQGTFLAGYLSAGMTKTNTVAEYVGIFIDPVKSFMEGYFWGVTEYNKVHGTNVKVLGYDPANPKNATVTGSWTEMDKGRQLGVSFMDEGADIILPVCGNVGAATAAVMQERGSGYIFGMDQDWTVTHPELSKQLLGSIIKKIDVHVYDAIKRVVENKWEAGMMYLTLGNGGIALAYNPAVPVPDALKAEIEALIPKIDSGAIVAWPTRPVVK
jgi:basic membrane protein A